MKKLVQINSVCRGSTGKIMLAIQQMADTEGYETISYYGRGTCANDVKTYKFGTESSFVADVLFTFLFGKQGAVACFQTKKLLEELEKEKPDIIHLHNIHGYYLNYPMLFEWLKKNITVKLFGHCMTVGHLLVTVHTLHMQHAKSGKHNVENVLNTMDILSVGFLIHQNQNLIQKNSVFQKEI